MLVPIVIFLVVPAILIWVLDPWNWHSKWFRAKHEAKRKIKLWF